MFENLKKTGFGKRIHRFSRLPVLGWPVRMLSRFVQSEFFQPSHLYPSNMAHNTRARDALAAFEASLK